MVLAVVIFIVVVIVAYVIYRNSKAQAKQQRAAEFMAQFSPFLDYNAALSIQRYIDWITTNGPPQEYGYDANHPIVVGSIHQEYSYLEELKCNTGEVLSTVRIGSPSNCSFPALVDQFAVNIQSQGTQYTYNLFLCGYGPKFYINRIAPYGFHF